MKSANHYDNDIKLLMDNIPSKEYLLLADALLFAVYGWTPEKLKKMKITSIKRWCELAKKRMTWWDAYKIRGALKEERKLSIWQRILGTES